MSCPACFHAYANSPGEGYRWNNTTVTILACETHLAEIKAVLNAAQRSILEPEASS